MKLNLEEQLDIFKLYLKKQGNSQNTILSYLTSLRLYLSLYSELDVESLRSYREYLLSRYRINTVNTRIHGINRFLDCVSAQLDGSLCSEGRRSGYSACKASFPASCGGSNTANRTEASKTPGNPDIPDAPQSSFEEDAPELSGIPAVSGLPAMPGASGMPARSETAVASASPDASGTAADAVPHTYYYKEASPSETPSETQIPGIRTFRLEPLKLESDSHLECGLSLPDPPAPVPSSAFLRFPDSPGALSERAAFQAAGPPWDIYPPTAPYPELPYEGSSPASIPIPGSELKDNSAGFRQSFQDPLGQSQQVRLQPDPSRPNQSLQVCQPQPDLARPGQSRQVCQPWPIQPQPDPSRQVCQPRPEQSQPVQPQPELSQPEQFCQPQSDQGGYKLNTVKKQQKTYLDSVISQRDYEKLKKRLKKDDNYFWYFVVRFLGATGARISELLQIKVENLKSGHLDLYSKGGKVRRLYLPRRLCDEALPWFEARGIKSGFIFLNHHGQVITSRGIGIQLKQLAVRYRIDPDTVYPHSFRHRFAKNFLRKFNDISLLADLMGHDSIETTRIYLTRSSEEQKELLDRIITW